MTHCIPSIYLCFFSKNIFQRYKISIQNRILGLHIRETFQGTLVVTNSLFLDSWVDFYDHIFLWQERTGDVNMFDTLQEGGF